MSKTKVWKGLTFLAVIALLLTNVGPVYALGTPRIESVNPPSGSPIGSNVCVKAAVDWDSDFRSMRIKFGSEGWQESAEISFQRCFGTNGYAPGWYTIRVEVAKVGEDWGSATSTEASYQLTEQSSGGDSGSSGSSSISCSVDSFDVWPNPAAVGDKVHISGSGSCNVGVRATKVRVDGHDLYEIGSPSLDWVWNTAGESAGSHKLKLWVAGLGDNNWNSAATSANIVIQLNAPGQSSNTDTPFNNSDVININGEIYVITVSGASVERHHVPNPDTLDALGIPRAWIDNKGLSDADLKAIHRGDDIPDVNRDYQGFIDFKNRYFPNTTPIVPNQPGNPSGPSGTPGSCPGWTTRLKPGDLAKVNDQGDGLRLRNGPSKESSIIREMPTDYSFQVVGGPVCNEGWTWWQIKTPDGTGWSTEGDDRYWISKPLGFSPLPTEQPAQGDPVPETQQPAVQGQPNFVDPNTILPKPEKSFLCSVLPLFCATEVDARYKPFEKGQCTWYVAGKRQDVVLWLPDHDADAKKWAGYAVENGIPVGFSVQDARVGDIVVFEPGSYSWVNTEAGHVAYVESVNIQNNSIHMSEYNGLKSRDYSERDVQVVTGMTFIHQDPLYNQSQPKPETQSGTPKGNWWNDWLKKLFGGK